ncbi:EamA family transporter RarD [Ferrimonas senticii]|uniref:EamA family transporter RarD n=1 Tax=Ferrimonas senticii TaxID=394566 RepID=UPI0003FA70F2|nr:EamA family transporter RarD [Ferrimonas senticii]
MPQQRQGVLFALAAYTMWGIAPLYFFAMKAVPADEILMHRILWSFLLVLGLVLLQGQWGQIRQLLKQPKKLAILTVSALVIASNWLGFIWAISNERVIDASLGYYINPLLNVALGMLVLKERPGKLSLVAIAVAATGVVLQLIQYGSVPLLSLFLASTFACYGLLRKRIQLQAATGLLIETALLLPLAVGYWYLLDTPTSNLANNSTTINTLLLAAGVVTTLPLLAFSAAATRIPFYLLGMLQYIGPTFMLLMALLVFNEPFKAEQTVTFGCIWAALVLMSIDAVLTAKRKRRERKLAAQG